MCPFIFRFISLNIIFLTLSATVFSFPPDDTESNNERFRFFQDLPLDASKKHVHLMHLDGFRADAFKDLIEHGQLPHFNFLLS